MLDSRCLRSSLRAPGTLVQLIVPIRAIGAAYGAARSEGFEEIADWFETLAKAERSHANKFQKTLDTIAD